MPSMEFLVELVRVLDSEIGHLAEIVAPEPMEVVVPVPLELVEDLLAEPFAVRSIGLQSYLVPRQSIVWFGLHLQYQVQMFH